MIKWWAYRHVNGTIQVKRFFDYSYREECMESDFVEGYTEPFEAEGREEAIEKAGEML